MPDKTLTTIKPRGYQQEIYNTCKDNNCLVILPTGIGKTLIALMLAISRQKAHPGTKILFLAPTRPLAQQHLDYFKKHLPELWADMQLFTGQIQAPERKKIWQTADIIFSTPQCIGNDIKNNLYNLGEVSLLVEDECHRCLKNYAYTYVAIEYIKQSKYQRILGLTASPGTDQKTIKQIAKNLNINAIELRTRESEDVKEYIQKIEYDTIKLDLPAKFQEIRQLLLTMYNRKVSELKKRRLLFGFPTKTNLIATQSRIMKTISSGNKDFNYLLGASACAQALKVSHAIELLETQTLHSLQEYFQELFEQARLKKSKAVQNIIKQPEFNFANTLLMGLLQKNEEHPKLFEVKKIIQEKIKENPKFKAMIFGQFRSTVTKISKEINSIPNINAKVFIGQAKKTNKAGIESGLSQKEQSSIIEEFSNGKINVLCATSIGEEGLDIPEVNMVIFYEPIPSAIRKIQRTGRTARLMKGQLIMLITKNTRDEAYYYAAFHKEKRMYSAIDSMKKELDHKNLESGKENKENNENKESKENANNKIQKTLF